MELNDDVWSPPRHHGKVGQARVWSEDGLVSSDVEWPVSKSTTSCTKCGAISNDLTLVKLTRSKVKTMKMVEFTLPGGSTRVEPVPFMIDILTPVWRCKKCHPVPVSAFVGGLFKSFGSAERQSVRQSFDGLVFAHGKQLVVRVDFDTPAGRFAAQLAVKSGIRFDVRLKPINRPFQQWLVINKARHIDVVGGSPPTPLGVCA